MKPTTEQIEQLLTLRNRIQGDIERLEEGVDLARREMAEEANRDDRVADIAALAQNQEAGLTMKEQLTQLLQRVDGAIKSVELGVYGKCVSCGGDIPRERLAAVPYADRCVECQRRLEKR